MNMGRKVYYGKSNGIIIWDKGEMTGDVREATLEEDMLTMPILKMVDSQELGILQFEYGKYEKEFQNCVAVKVNTNTKQLEFLLKQ